MLGFAPLAALPLAATTPLALTTEQLASSGAITFSGSAEATYNSAVFISAEINIGLFGSATPTGKVYLNPDRVTIRFNGRPLLRTAGKPFQVAAIPQSYTVRAVRADYTIKALPRSYTVRAKR